MAEFHFIMFKVIENIQIKKIKIQKLLLKMKESSVFVKHA